MVVTCAKPAVNLKQKKNNSLLGFLSICYVQGQLESTLTRKKDHEHLRSSIYEEKSTKELML